MKRFFTAVVFCLVIGSFITACATTINDKRGYGGKKSMPKPAQEQVVPQDSASQPAPSQTQDADAPTDSPSKSE